MALACAWLGGELKQRHYLTGKTTAEVNQHAESGAHEWARYTAEDGTVTILDVAGHHVGGMVTKAWDYRRPEEKRVVVPPPGRFDREKIKTKGRFAQFLHSVFKDVVEESGPSRS